MLQNRIYYFTMKNHHVIVWCSMIFLLSHFILNYAKLLIIRNCKHCMYVLPHAYPFVSALGRIHLNFVLMKIYIKNHQEDNGKTNVIGNLLMDTFLYRKNILLRKFYQQVKLILINCTINHWKCHDLIDFIFIHFLKVSLLHQMELKDEQSPFYWLSCRKVEQKILKHFFYCFWLKKRLTECHFVQYVLNYINDLTV